MPLTRFGRTAIDLAQVRYLKVYENDDPPGTAALVIFSDNTRVNVDGFDAEEVEAWLRTLPASPPADGRNVKSVPLEGSERDAELN